jgi:hypothetical protein
MDIVNCTTLDEIRIQVLGDSRYLRIPADKIVEWWDTKIYDRVESLEKRISQLELGDKNRAN